MGNDNAPCPTCRACTVHRAVTMEEHQRVAGDLLRLKCQVISLQSELGVAAKWAWLWKRAAKLERAKHGVLRESLAWIGRMRGLLKAEER